MTPRPPTSNWLSSILGYEVDIRSSARVGEAYGLASEIFRLELTGGPVGDVVVKRWDLDSPAGTAEIRFYEHFGGRLDIPLPVCLAGGSDGSTGYLVLSALDGFRQGDVLVDEGDDVIERIVRMLGRLHGQWWGSAELDRLPWLRDAMTTLPDDAWCADRRSAFLDRFGQPQSDLAGELLARAPEVLARGTAILGRVPATLVHGDAHLDNFLFAPGTGEPYLIDWAGCRRGPGAQDLTAVLVGMAAGDTRRRLLDAYHDALVEHGASGVSQEDVVAMAGGALHWMFVFWTLGTARWMPTTPRESAMQRDHLKRIEGAVDEWQSIDPGVFDAVAG
ncbi:MAG: aminoglycoside phosphotransferase family protein [Acidimicrobiia bacterium]|nr:aminoglycoside phosphotransferase family protein [Acidimicrobiia bacterium]NNL70366.1 aminoglycoside phosphotransferase family protein [Acidimicrobiia bacterium]